MANTEAWREPGELALQALRPGHLAGALALSREAGWNQTERDWEYMLAHGDGWAYADSDTPPAATALILPYGGRFGWISMVLVATTWRRQGLATNLLRVALERLLEQEIVPGLDATPEGREVYRPLGFRDVYPLTRLLATQVRINDNCRGSGLRSLAHEDLPGISRSDAMAFGADRSALLQHLLLRAPVRAFGAAADTGHVFARGGSDALQLGPLVATDSATAVKLATKALDGVVRPVYVDVPDHQQIFHRWLRRIGFSPQRRFVRMLHGRHEAMDDPARIFAIAGPELG